MSMPEVSTSGDSAADLDAAEREFVESMDAVQEYMQLQTKLQEQLKQGLLSLARAKYSMGPIGQTQYDMDMTASVRVAVSSDEAPAEAATATGSGRHSLTLRRAPARARPRVRGGGGGGAPAAADPGADAGAKGPRGPGGAADGSESSGSPGRVGASGSAAVAEGGGQGPTTTVGGAAVERAAVEADADVGEEEEVGVDWSDEEGGEDGGEEDEGLKEANEFLRRMRMEAEAEASGGGGDGAAGTAGDGAKGGSQGQQQQQQQQQQQRRRRQGGGGGDGDPLHWFGVLVPPALKEAQSQFAAALETCVALANTAQRVLPRSRWAGAAAATAERGGAAAT